MISLQARLNKLEAKRQKPFADVLSLIEAHRYYDEISEDERTRYCAYIGIDKQSFAETNLLVLGGLHVALKQIEKPEARKLQNIITEIESVVLGEEQT